MSEPIDDHAHPAPAHFPSYRKPSKKSAPEFRDATHRRASAGAFARGADDYADVRPGYPTDVGELIADAQRVLDVGAGTGKLTATLGNPMVVACDPSPDMCRVLRAGLGVPVWRATAEATALADASVDAVTCAQTWHWVDVAQASAEFDRIIRPGGHVLLAWNTLDVHADPWVLRLARIMHSGDIQKEGFYPAIEAPWQLATERRLRWSMTLTPQQLHRLMHTRSYWLRNDDKIHQRMTHNLNWYLFDHLGFKPEQPLEIPYRTDAFLYWR